jgi:uncharacterized HAD superfamily protein
MKKTYVFDIDGTLTLESEGFGYETYRCRTPKDETIKMVQDLMKEGNTIILYTSRWESDREVTEEWLKKNFVPYDQLIFGKIQYDYWIDDKAINEQVFRVMGREKDYDRLKVYSGRVTI